MGKIKQHCVPKILLEETFKLWEQEKKNVNA